MGDPRYENLFEALLKATSILITGTASADGDSVGAELALRRILIQFGKLRQLPYSVHIINDAELPERYCFIADHDVMEVVDAKCTKQWTSTPFDLAFVLDGGVERSGKVQPIFEAAHTRVLVDHHAYGSDASYDIDLSRSDATATTVLVYELFQYLKQEANLNLDPALASQIYLGLIFDTGLFRHSNTTPHTMRVAAELIETGFDFSAVARQALIETSIPARRLLGSVLHNATFDSQTKRGVGLIDDTMLKAAGARSDESEGIIDHLLAVKEVDVAVLVIEVGSGQYKVSFRSKGRIDVGKVARSVVPDGGGHAKASGCLLEVTSIDEARTRVIQALDSEEH